MESRRDSRALLCAGHSRNAFDGLYQEQRQLAVDLSEVNETLERANLQFAAALIATLDARDRYTAGHSAAVAIYSRDIAQRMGLPTRFATRPTSAASCTTSGSSASLRDSSRSLARSRSRSAGQAGALGNRRTHPRSRERFSEIATIFVRHHHSADLWPGLSGRSSRLGHSARSENHCGRRRLQRDDVRSAITATRRPVGLHVSGSHKRSRASSTQRQWRPSRQSSPARTRSTDWLEAQGLHRVRAKS